MDSEKYTRVSKPRDDEKIGENEVRITTQGSMRNYIAYATNLFNDKGQTEVHLRAMGRAINKCVTVAEILKRRIAGLHQNTGISSTEIVDEWLPKEEGLEKKETIRHVSSIAITLSTQPLDTSSPGYQPPIPADQVKPASHVPGRPQTDKGDKEDDNNASPADGGDKPTRGGRRGRGRSRRQGNKRKKEGGEANSAPAASGDAPAAVDPAPDADTPAAEGAAPRGRGGRRGRGRGRGRRGQGRRGRGGRGGGQANGDSAPAAASNEA